MNKEKEELFYTRYLQKKFYFKNKKMVHALFYLEKYLFENYNFNEEVPISNIKYKWIYNCIEKNDFSNEISKNLSVLADSKSKTNILLLIDTFSQIPNLTNTTNFFKSLTKFNKIFNDLIDSEVGFDFNSSLYFQFIFLVYIKKYQMNNFLREKINLIEEPVDFFEIVFVKLFFKNYNYKVSKINYLFKLLIRFIIK